NDPTLPSQILVGPAASLKPPNGAEVPMVHALFATPAGFVNYAKLNKKRATEANAHLGAENSTSASLVSDASSQTNNSAGTPLAAQISNDPSQAAISVHQPAQYHPTQQALPQQQAQSQYAHHPHPRPHPHLHAQPHAHASSLSHSHSHGHQQQMLPTTHPSRAMQQEYVYSHSSHIHPGASSNGPAQHIPQTVHSAPWPQPTYYQQQQQQQQSAYQYGNASAHVQQQSPGGYVPHGHHVQPPPPYHHHHSAGPSYASSTSRSSNASLAHDPTSAPASAPASASVSAQHPGQQSPLQSQPRPVKASISRILG
ncbi:hypothetical protein FB639_002829, partial [Coemansia asiatica]